MIVKMLQITSLHKNRDHLKTIIEEILFHRLATF